MKKRKITKKELDDITQKKEVLNQDLLKLAAGDAPFLILEKELQVLQSQSKKVNTELDREANKKTINNIIDQFKEFSKKLLR